MVSPDSGPRIFCVGMNKTGTSTMRRCFEILRLLPVASPESYGNRTLKRIIRFYSDKNYGDMLELAQHYRSFEDRPWNMWSMYQHLDQRFPDSLFILTEREPDSWWRSTERWVTASKPHLLARYQLQLRADQPNREAMVAGYLRYNKEVMEYFESSSRLLTMNMEAGDGWEKLCSFLGVPIPDEPFPHVNRQAYSDQDYRWLESQRRFRHGIQCQACGNITDVREQEKQQKLGKKQYEFRTLKDVVLRLFPRESTRRWFAKLTPHRLEISRIFRLAPYMVNQAIRILVKPRELLRQLPPLEEKQLALVSCFFNPSGSRRRIENFNSFLAGVKASGVRCLVVELAFGSSPHQITSHDDVIQLRSDDVMWHKEKLLNIGIKQLLSESYENIVWLDGDIQFDEPDWPQVLVRQLSKFNLCQVFSEASIRTHTTGAPVVGSSAVKYFMDSGGTLYRQPRRGMRDVLRGRLRGGFSGFGWAARAEVLEKVLLFENAVVGGGDKLMLAASLERDLSDSRLAILSRSKIECANCGHRNQSEPYTRSYKEWSQLWSAAVQGKVGYAPLHIRDMYHGNRNDRGYMKRIDILLRHDFDPQTDLAFTADGGLQWASDKPELHREVEAYFLSRREDIQ